MAKKTETPTMSQSIKAVLKQNPTMSTPEVIATLDKQGIKVKAGLVYFVKGTLTGGKKRRKVAAPTKNGAVKKTGDVNKSQAIRDLLTETPRMSTREVVAALGEKGIKVLPSNVYFIKGKMKGRKRRIAKEKIASEKVATVTANSDPLATIKKVKGLAEEVGGLKKLQALVQALAE